MVTVEFFQEGKRFAVYCRTLVVLCRHSLQIRAGRRYLSSMDAAVVRIDFRNIIIVSFGVLKNHNYTLEVESCVETISIASCMSPFQL